MNERIKELAEEAGLITFKFGEQGGYTTIQVVSDLNNLERFAELVRQDERERIKQENQRGYVFNPDGTYQGSGGGGRPQGEGRTE